MQMKQSGLYRRFVYHPKRLRLQLKLAEKIFVTLFVCVFRCPKQPKTTTRSKYANETRSYKLKNASSLLLASV